MDTEPLVSKSHEVRTMREALATYLQAEGSSADQLVNWLQGYLPIGSSSEEPFVWLLRGLPLAGERKAARRQLGLRVASLLDTAPEIHRPGRRPEQLIHNLLMLAAGLGPLHELAPALQRLFDNSELIGEYRGLPLRSSLRMALIENQLDTRWANIWFEMLESGGSPKLPGGPSHGFDGVLHLPLSLRSPEGSFMDYAGRALKAMAVHLQNDPKRRPRFRAFLAQVGEARGGPKSHAYDLILQADLNSWPSWAVETLPSLHEIVTPTQDPRTILTWYWYRNLLEAASLSREAFRQIDTLCGGLVIRCTIEAVTLDQMDDILVHLENGRRLNTFHSDRSIVAGLQHCLRVVIDKKIAAVTTAQNKRFLDRLIFQFFGRFAGTRKKSRSNVARQAQALQQVMHQTKAQLGV